MLIPRAQVILPIVRREMVAEVDQDTGAAAGMETKLLVHLFEVFAA